MSPTSPASPAPVALSRAARAALPLLPLVAVVAGLASLGGCRIFGAAAVPCSNDNAEQECRPEQICLDGTCQDRPVTAPACPAPPRDVTGGVRKVLVGASPVAGIDAMGPRLFGLDEDLALDLGCAPSCETLAAPAPVARAPLLDGVSAAGLEDGPLTVTGARPDTAGPFAFEVVFRSPAGDEVHDVVGVTDGAGSGWRVVAGGGLTSLLVGDTEVVLAAASEAVWTHLLCFVDPATLDAGAPAGVLCSVDGALPVLPPTTAGPYAPASAPLVLGDTVGNDGAVALVRTWSGRPPELPADAGAALGALVEEGRRRLLRYAGVLVEAPGSILISNLNVAPRVVELPAAEQRPRALTLVGGNWPRLADVDGARGILFEPTSENLLGDYAATCRDRARGPTGRLDACALVSPLVVDTAVPRDTEFTLSAYTVKGASDVVVVLEDGTGGLGARRVECSLIDDVAACVAGVDTFSATLADVGDHQRFAVTLRLNFEVSRVRIASGAADVVWSPQLELGAAATSPIPFLVSFQDRFTAARASDVLLLSEVGLGSTSELSLEAKVLASDEEIFPVTVLDDEEFDDGFLQLVASFPPAGAGLPAAELVGRVDQKDLEETRADIALPPVTVGAHVGTEVSSCAPCDDVGPVRAGRMQAELVLFLGPGAVIEHASVSSRGAEPRPTPLVLDVGAPPVAPCLDGKEPLFVFAACPGGLCEEGLRSRFDDAAAAARHLVAGAFPGELAATGRFTTDLLEEDFFGTLYLEARFQTPAIGPGAELVVVKDTAGPLASFALQANDDGSYTLVVAADGVERAVTTLGPAEWNQLACLFDEPVRCLVNLDEPITFTEFGALRAEPLLSATVGAAGVEAPVAAARAFFVDRPADQEEATALLSERALASFGLLTRARRATVVASEVRGTPSFALNRAGPDGPLLLRRIGPHWPRVEDSRGVLEYTAEPGGHDPYGDDLLAALGGGGRPGPHPSLRALVIDEGGTVDLPPDAEAGVVSLFVSGLDDGDRVELSSGGARVVVPGGQVDGGAGGVDDFGAWQRLWLLAGPGQGASVAVVGSALLSTPQRDPRAARPGPPALDDERAEDALRLLTGDLTTANASVVRLVVDPTSVDGRFFVLRGSTGSSAEAVSLVADGEELLLSLEQRQGVELPSTGVESFGVVGPLDDVTWWWRENVSVVRTGDGGLLARPTAALSESADRVVVGSEKGGARVRLRSLTVRRGDLSHEP